MFVRPARAVMAAMPPSADWTQRLFTVPVAVVSYLRVDGANIDIKGTGDLGRLYAETKATCDTCRTTRHFWSNR